MGLGDQIRQFKTRLSFGSELLWLRIRMLRLDALAQLRSVILLLAALLLASVVFFLSFISLLFALNSILSPTAKIWVFFGLTGFLALAIVALLVWVGRLWRQQGHFMEETLDAMAEDFAYLRQRPSDDEDRRHE